MKRLRTNSQLQPQTELERRKVTWPCLEVTQTRKAVMLAFIQPVFEIFCWSQSFSGRLPTAVSNIHRRVSHKFSPKLPPKPSVSIRPSISQKDFHRYFIGYAGGPRKSHRMNYTVFRLQLVFAFGASFGSHKSCNYSQWWQDWGSEASCHQRLPGPLRCITTCHDILSYNLLVRPMFLALTQLQISYQVFKNCEMDGHCENSSSLLHFLGRTNLTSAWPFHSPASLHSSSHTWNRCPLPGQIWSWEDCGLRPHYTTTSRTYCRRMLCSGHVSHTRTRISDQEWICTI